MVVLHFFISFPIPFVGLEVELFTYSAAPAHGLCPYPQYKGLQALSMVDMNFTTTPILCSSLKKHIEIFGK